MTMREQIARAIAKVHYDDDEIDRPALRWSPQGMTRATTPVWQDYLAEADAALAALAQPTKAMEDAAQSRPLRWTQDDCPVRSIYYDIWTTMVAAIQQEK